MKHWLSWGVLILVVCAAIFFITQTTGELPKMVASHFDAAGNPTAFVARASYLHFMLLIGIGAPLILVALLTVVYSRAADMKLPNADYWLAPLRIDRTRSFLVAHGIWFGSLLISVVCYAHWLELKANHQRPAHLPDELVYPALLLFFLLTVGWMAVLMRRFRRPRGA